MAEPEAGAAPDLPAAEAAHLAAAYAGARVILEYGSGGSTRLAAALPGRLVISVESDAAWARAMQAEIDAMNPPAAVIVHHADIGPTGAWGRPRDIRAWRRFHRYPLGVWEAPFFRHPDVVLIDGRMRSACLATVLLCCTRPVRVLFDDYAGRPSYHALEPVIRPARLVGRMAEFAVVPGLAGPAAMPLLVAQFAAGSLATWPGTGYDRPGTPWTWGPDAPPDALPVEAAAAAPAAVPAAVPAARPR